ncbi:MAG: TIGR03960 family B12-binding radical SAM protein, partial [bacterium]
DLAGIPVRSSERDDSHPLVIAGGPCAFNPEPLAEYIDAFVIGEGEEAVREIAAAVRAAKQNNIGKQQLIRSLSKIEGVYAPSLYATETAPDGTVSVAPGGDAPYPVCRRYVKNLDKSFFPDRFVVPYVEAIHDRIQTEVFRGCAQGCRYCQAGMIYRPMRTRSADLLVGKARALYGSMGCEEVSLLSLNASDYPEMGALLDGLNEFCYPARVSVSLPSSRIDTFSEEVGEKLRRVRGTGLTLAPEAGTQRLRNVINKRITEEEIMRALDAALAAGWKKIKLYFMIGLPAETMEDVEGIAELLHRMCDRVRQVKGKSAAKTDFKASVANFVPKPHTPFQWEPMDTTENLLEKQRLLRRLIDPRRVKLDRHSVETSLLEGVMARGDRRVGRVIEAAWKLGCRFDGWGDMFRFDLWMQAFAEAGINPEDYAYKKYRPMSRLPWSHVSCGVTEKYLFIEHEKAFGSEETTDGCVKGPCTGCGIGCGKP